MHGMERVVQLQKPRLQHLPPAEREQLLGERRGTLGRLHQFRERIVAIDNRRHVVDFQQIGASDDDGEEIIEVVGDASGQLSHRFEPLGLTQLLFEILLSRTIGQKPACLHELAGLVELSDRVGEHGDDVSILTAQRELEPHQALLRP